MQKTNIKYLVLFLSIVINQINAESSIGKIKTDIIEADSQIRMLLNEVYSKKKSEEPQTLLLTQEALEQQQQQSQKRLQQWIQTIQSNILNTAIPFIEKRNKGRFSNKTLEQSIMTIKLKTLNIFRKTTALSTLNDQKALIKILNSSIDQLESQKAKLTKEYFLLPDKRKARDLALVVFNVLINLYTMHRDYIEYYNNQSQQFII